MSSHDYKGHVIRVDQLPGLRPWAVWVDGVLVMGSGERVRRRLAYSTAAAALDAGKKFVRECARLKALDESTCAAALEAAGFRTDTDTQVPAQQHEEQQHEQHEADRVADAVTDGRAEQRQDEPQHQDEHQEVNQGPGAKPTPRTRPNVHDCGCCGHAGEVHVFYETNLSYACTASGCECLAFREAP